MQGFILPFFIQRRMEGDDIGFLDQRLEGAEVTFVAAIGARRIAEQRFDSQRLKAFLQTPEEARTCIPYYPYAGVRGLCALYVRSPQAAVRAYSELWQLSLTSWQQAYARIKEL